MVLFLHSTLEKVPGTDKNCRHRYSSEREMAACPNLDFDKIVIEKMRSLYENSWLDQI